MYKSSQTSKPNLGSNNAKMKKILEVNACLHSKSLHNNSAYSQVNLVKVAAQSLFCFRTNSHIHDVETCMCE